MSCVPDIERKVEKMKEESDNTAHQLSQLRHQREDLVSHRDHLREKVSMLMQRSQHKEQVCCNLQYEISQLRRQLTGTSIALGQTSTPVTVSSTPSGQASPASQATSQNPAESDQVPISKAEPSPTSDGWRSPGNVVAFPASPAGAAAHHNVASPVPSDGQFRATASTPPGVCCPQALNFSSPQPVSPHPQAPIRTINCQSDVPMDVQKQGGPGGQPFPSMLVSSPAKYYASGSPLNMEYSPIVQSYFPSPDHLPPSCLTGMGYDDPNKYFNLDQEADGLFPELSMFSRQAAADPSDLFNAIVDNMCSDDPFPDLMFGGNLPLPFEDGGPSMMSSPAGGAQAYPNSPGDLDAWVSPGKRGITNEGVVKQGSVDPKPADQS